jgi:hypothetical protein
MIQSAQQKTRTPRRFAQMNKSIRLARRRAKVSEFILHAKGVDFARMMRREAMREQS